MMQHLPWHFRVFIADDDGWMLSSHIAKKPFFQQRFVCSNNLCFVIPRCFNTFAFTKLKTNAKKSQFVLPLRSSNPHSCDFFWFFFQETLMQRDEHTDCLDFFVTPFFNGACITTFQLPHVFCSQVQGSQFCHIFHGQAQSRSKLVAMTIPQSSFLPNLHHRKLTVKCHFHASVRWENCSLKAQSQLDAPVANDFMNHFVRGLDCKGASKSSHIVGWEKRWCKQTAADAKVSQLVKLATQRFICKSVSPAKPQLLKLMTKVGNGSDCGTAQCSELS